MSPPVERVCAIGVWNDTIPGITFDENGISNYYYLQKQMMEECPRDERGKKDWERIVRKIKENGKSRHYDCIIGVSGGTDSSYLLHVAKEYGLRPLAVHLDNGWNSAISVTNISLVTSALGIDLETYVVEYEEMKDILRAYIRAGLPWVDGPSDLAIQSALYKIAVQERINYILMGNDFRSEGKQPSEWTYSDAKQLKHIHRRFGQTQLKTYPLLPLSRLLYLSYVRGIRLISPYNYINYEKKEAQKFLQEKYGWEYYGEHHHENVFTTFTLVYWLPMKFHIDKRLITYSAQIVSGELTREEALERINRPKYSPQELEEMKGYILKKLDLTEEEFKRIWNSPNKSVLDYPSNYLLLRKVAGFIFPVVRLVLPTKPKIFHEIEVRGR